jgi:hypothetical protein
VQPDTRRDGSRPDSHSPEPGGSRAYHRIVIAEFVVTIVLIGLSPVLVPRTSKSVSPAQEAADAVGSASLAGPLVRLTAACIAFFVLSLMSTGKKSGKIAAAFGGLIVLGTLINATDMLTAIAQAFAPPKTAASSSPGSPAAGALAAAGAANALGALTQSPAPTPGGTGTGAAPAIGELS